MPPKDNNTLYAGTSSMPLPVFEEEAGSGRLGLIKKALIAAGYENELNKYRSGTWFEEAVKSGIIRNGDGDSIDLGKKGNLTASEREKAATDILLSNTGIYISDRDNSRFHKLAYDAENETLRAREYQTPPRLNRPNFVLMFLDYCGFKIPSVEQYKQAKQQVKDNPLYNSLHTDKARDTSNTFIRKSAEHDMTLDPPEHNPDELERVQFRAKIDSANLEKKLENGENLTKSELENLFEARLKMQFNKPEMLAELDENPELLSYLKNNFSNSERVRSMLDPNKSPQEINFMQRNFVVGGLDNNAAKLWNLVCKSDNKIVAKAAVDINPVAVKKEEPEQIKEEPKVKSEVVEPVQQPQQEVVKAPEEKKPSELEFKIADLERQMELYPDSSPIKDTLASAVQSLKDVNEKGLPENPFDPKYEEQLLAVKQASAKLAVMNRIDKVLKSDDINSIKLLTSANENSAKIREAFEKNTGLSSAEKLLGDDPAKKFTEILTDEKSLNRFSASMMKDVKENPGGNLIPEKSVVFGKIYKQPGVNGWQRMPGATEEEVNKSVLELSNLPSDNRILKMAAAAEQKSKTKSQLTEKRNSDTEKLNKRIEEMTELTESYPKNTVMYAIGQNALTSLKTLRDIGMPSSPESPAFKTQQSAMKDAIANVCAFQKAKSNKIVSSEDNSINGKKSQEIEKYTKLFRDDKLLDNMVKSDNGNISSILLDREIEHNALILSVNDEESHRLTNGIPETAERKGVLYRMKPGEPWKQAPGASLKEVNDSYLTVSDEKITEALVSHQKASENIHISDATMAYGI